MNGRDLFWRHRGLTTLQRSDLLTNLRADVSVAVLDEAAGNSLDRINESAR